MNESDKEELVYFFNTIKDAFTMSEEEKELRREKKRSKYRMYSGDDVERILTSNLPFEEKKRLLSEEKQRASELLRQIESSERKLENSGVFLNGMKMNLRELLNTLKHDGFFTLFGGAFSAFSINDLVKFLEENHLSDMQYNQVGAYSLGCVLLPILTMIYIYYTGRDIRDINKYCKEIKGYERRLKK